MALFGCGTFFSALRVARPGSGVAGSTCSDSEHSLIWVNVLQFGAIFEKKKWYPVNGLYASNFVEYTRLMAAFRFSE